jgi:hypothetical protein
VALKHKIKIKYREQKKSFEISGTKEAREKISKLLLSKKNCFVESRVWTTRSFLEIDYRALKTLLEEGEKIGAKVVEKQPLMRQIINDEAIKEDNLVQLLNQKNYNLRPRIWDKYQQSGDRVFFTEVEGDIYSCPDLNGLIALLNGNYLLESNKPRTRFSLNFLIDFGLVDVISDCVKPNKSPIHYNFRNQEGDFAILNGSRKKQYNLLLNRAEDRFKVIIDGADDVAVAMNNAGLPQQTITLIQALLVFPIFLRGVYIGYEGMSSEAKETHENYQMSQFKKTKIEVELENFKKELCELCDLDYEALKEQSPQHLIREIGASLVKTKNDSWLSGAQKDEELSQIVVLSNLYQGRIAAEFEAPEMKDVLVAYAGYLAMASMMSSVLSYKSQAFINLIFGEIKGFTTSSGKEPSFFARAGTNFGFVGQIFMMFYATYKTVSEHKEWQEVEAELKQFESAADVSDLAKKITSKILQAQSNNHKTKTFGNASLVAGQIISTLGGPFGVGFNPLTYLGLIATLGGVAASNISELRYKMSCGINDELDEIENTILNTPPQFSFADFSDVATSLKKHSLRTIFALEVLGHLRAPHLVLYEKFVEQNKDEEGILSQAYGFLGGTRIIKWLNKPPRQSVDLVKDNPRIAINPDNPNNLDLFLVNQSDLDLVWQKADELLLNHNLSDKNKAQNHQKIVQELQNNFIERKFRESLEKPPDSAMRTCQKILDAGGLSADYLQKKLLRAVANKELICHESPKINLPEIQKNGKKIEIAKLDLTKFDENDLANFVTRKRPQKTLSSLQKKSTLATAHQKEIFNVKSQHLRPFVKIGEISKAAADLVITNDNKSAEKLTRSRVQASKTLTQRGAKIPITRSVADKLPVMLPQKEILEEFDLLAKEKVATGKNQRQIQVKKQNELIDKITKEGQKFILKSKKKDNQKNQTIFVYLDPRNQDSKDHQVVYVRDDRTNKISVLYGAQSSAILVERAREQTNGFVAKIKDGAVSKFGDAKNSAFKSFEKIDKIYQNKKPGSVIAAKNNPQKLAREPESEHFI